jgi:DNA repair exonuclease SbcCD ATPase subunit
MLTIANTLENLDKLILTEKQVKAAEEYCLGMIPQIENKIAQLDKTITLIAEAREYWRKAIDIAYERSIGELNERLNSAIKYIYFDRDFTVELTLEDKRGKSLLILLKDEEGNEVSLKDGTGMGVRTIISVILHMYYLNAKGSHVLLVDEKYSYLSESYIPKFFEFLTRLCVAMDFKLIVITHDPRFFDYANKKIRVVSGEVKYE